MFVKFRQMFIKICKKNQRIWPKIEPEIAKFAKISTKLPKNFTKICWNLNKFWVWSGAKVCKSCRSRKMLKNEPTLAIGGVDTAEIWPSEVWRRYQHTIPPWVIYTALSSSAAFRAAISASSAAEMREIRDRCCSASSCWAAHFESRSSTFSMSSWLLFVKWLMRCSRSAWAV